MPFFEIIIINTTFGSKCVYNMTKYRINLITLVALVLFIAPTHFCAFAQQLTLEDIYKNNKYQQRGIASLRWMEDNCSYSTLEANREIGGRDIVKYDIKTGERSVIVSASSFVKGGKKIYVEDYIWSQDNSKLLVYTNSKRVWRDNTRGDYWVLELKTGIFNQIGEGLDPSRMMFAKFSPSSDKVAFVYYNNIYVEDIRTGERKQLTFDGSDEIINGNFDWVYEEELGIQDGFRWSPDGKTIAYWHSDTRGTGVFYMINNVDSLYSTIIPFPYPKVGTPNSAVKVGVVDIESAQSRWFDVPGDPRNHYLARMDFIPNSNEVMIQQLNRLQNTNKVFIGDVSSMQLKNIYTDRDDAFLNVHDNIVWLEGEKYFTWTSEKDGWRHLYKVSRDGKKETLITKGEFDVMNISCIDPKGGYVYYLASPESAIDRYLYRSRLDGKGEMERVTPEDKVGYHGYIISGNGEYALHTFQNSTTPPIYEIVSLKKHKTIRVLQDNKSLKERYDSLSLIPKEFYRVDIGDAVLDGWIIKPKDFDETKKYPVIFHIYGEPASSTVLNTWSKNDLWHQFLAQQGYVVMSVDPRGTNMPKGREWRKSIYGKVGTIGPQDHAKAVELLLAKYPFIDKERVGIWGWSGGGSSTMHAMFKYPEIYKTGIAVAGVSLQNLYDTIYQERYMGLPSTNPEGFYNGSPINFAQNLEGKLLLIHGTGDDNVHYQSLEMVVNKLIECNKMFSMFAYPMRAHGIYEGKNTTYHLYQMMLKYWLENL